MKNDQKFSGPRVGETIFTMFLFFKRDLNGREYTQSEIDNKFNRKPFPSYDYTETKQGFTITDHRKGLEKFRVKVNKMVAMDNLISGYIRAEQEHTVIITFGRDGIYRNLFFAEFDQYKHTLKKLIKNVTVVTPATKALPTYNNINSPEKEKYYKRAELYKESTAKHGKLSAILRTQLQTPQQLRP